MAKRRPGLCRLFIFKHRVHPSAQRVYRTCPISFPMSAFISLRGREKTHAPLYQQPYKASHPLSKKAKNSSDAWPSNEDLGVMSQGSGKVGCQTIDKTTKDCSESVQIRALNTHEHRPAC